MGNDYRLGTLSFTVAGDAPATRGTAAPEPLTLSLLASGLARVGFVRRRKA